MSAPSDITMRALTEAAAEHFGITRFDLVSQRRDAVVVRPRQIVMYLAKELTARSLPEIGRHLGGRDHTTVLHGVRVIEALVESSAEIRAALSAIRSRLQTKLRPVERRERDPMVVAIEIATGSRRATDVAVAEIEDMARALVGYGRVLGVVTLDDEAGPDPERLPATVPDAALVQAVAAVVIARERVRRETHTRTERHARDTLEEALQRLQTTHNDLSKGL